MNNKIGRKSAYRFIWCLAASSFAFGAQTSVAKPGEFTISSVIPVGNGPHSVIAADFADLSGTITGTQDLAVAHALIAPSTDPKGDLIYILSGDGSGGFVATQNEVFNPMKTGRSPVALAAAKSAGTDCGKPVIVSTNKLADTISVFSPTRGGGLGGEGTTVYKPATTPTVSTDSGSPIQSIPSAVVSLELDAGGSLDELVVGQEATSKIRVFTGNGECGKYAQRQTDLEIPFEQSLLGLAVVDADGRGLLDIVAATRGPDPATTTVDLGGRLTTFISKETSSGSPAYVLSSNPPGFDLPPGSRSIAVGNFNGDLQNKKNDLAIANEYSDSITIAYRNPTKGGFLGNRTLTLGTARSGAPACTDASGCQQPAFVLADDFNGDGYSDLAVGFVKAKYIAIYLNRQRSPSTPPPAPPLDGSVVQLPTTPDQFVDLTDSSGRVFCDRVVSLTSIDIDRDNDKDIAAACLNSDVVVILKNN